VTADPPDGVRAPSATARPLTRKERQVVTRALAAQTPPSASPSASPSDSPSDSPSTQITHIPGARRAPAPTPAKRPPTPITVTSQRRWSSRVARAAAHDAVRARRATLRWLLGRRLRQTWLPALITGVAALMLALALFWGPQFLAPLTTPSLAPSAWQSSASANAIGGGAAPGTTVPGSAGGPAPTTTPAPTPTNVPAQQPTPTPGGGVFPAPETPWPPRSPWNPTADHPGVEWVNGCWAFSGGWGDANGWCRWFGQCTWLAAERARGEHYLGLGDAAQWRWTAAQRGYRVGSTPIVGATVVFQPGIEGAGGAGHVAHVIAVFPDGWFEIAEMNFYWNGGGWGRIDWRYVYVSAGVNFIY